MRLRAVLLGPLSFPGNKYRSRYVRIDAILSGIGIAIFIAILLAFSYVDYHLFGLSDKYYYLLALRCAGALGSVAFIVGLLRTRSYSTYDRLVLVWAALGFMVIFLIDLTRPADYLLNFMMDAAMIATGYAIFRVMIVNQILLSTCFSLASLAILIFVKNQSFQAVFSVFIAFLLANSAGILVSWSFQYYRQREYYDRERQAIDAEVIGQSNFEQQKLYRLDSLYNLSARIGHVFNNMLEVIIKNINSARDLEDMNRGTLNFESTDKEDMGGTVNRLENARRASLRAANLCRRLLILDVNTKPDFEFLLLQDLIVEIVTPLLEGMSVKSDFIIQEDLWPVEADEAQITQVVKNLMNNSQQAMPDGGLIILRLSNVVLDEWHDLRSYKGRYVELRIKDNGVGMTKDILDRAFEPFFTTKPVGQGMGLAVAKSIVKSHCGFMKIESNNNGTEVSVYLPASDIIRFTEGWM